MRRVKHVTIVLKGVTGMVSARLFDTMFLKGHDLLTIAQTFLGTQRSDVKRNMEINLLQWEFNRV
eukprot:9200763-Karenia_brevis.AAC.1